MRLYLLISLVSNTNPAGHFYKVTSPDEVYLAHCAKNPNKHFPREEFVIIDIVGWDHDTVNTLKWDNPSQTWVVTETHQINL